MNVNTRKGPVIDPGLCRCCGVSKKCRLLNVEYEWIGQKEVYSDMFVDTFGLLLSNLDGEPAGRLICATCVSRLRDASLFRRQVLCCEETLLQARLASETEVPEIKQEKEQTGSEAKQETECDNTTPYEDDDHHIEDHIDDVAQDEDLHKNISTKEDPPPKRPKKVKKEKLKKKSKEREPKKKLGRRKKIKTKTLAEIKAECMMDDQLIETPKSRPKPTENELRIQHNILTIVENSFVCPFDTSFSDYYCVYCRQSFSDPDQLRDHNLTHDPNTFKQIVKQKKLTQIDITKVDCRLCHQKIDNLNDLKLHLARVHSKLIHEVSNEFLKFKLTNTNLNCLECNSSFTFFHALKKHMADHFGSCICDICGAHYFEERMLILHQKTHQRVDETFPCSECGKIFKSKHSRYLHEARTHKREPAYQCPKCDEVLFSYSLRYRHMIEIHGDKRSFQCSHCDRTYDSRKSLREHNRRYHLKIFKHQCDLCDKRFYIPSRLKEHLATHTGERNYRCDHCGKSYPRLRGLKVHLQSHSNEKKYRCVLCNAAFTQNVNLKNHIKRQHQGLDVDDFHE